MSRPRLILKTEAHAPDSLLTPALAYLTG